MKRRNFSWAALGGLVGSSLVWPAAQAQGNKPVQGKDYFLLERPEATDAPAGKVEVVEFFNYNCPHCASFEPRLQAWVKQLPDYVVFRRIPVPFVGSDPETKQRLYYTLDAMGKAEAMVQKVFNAIHLDKQNLTGDAAVLAWVQQQPGLDAKQFKDLFQSFGIVGKAKRASMLTNAYKVQGVPALGVGGKYYTDGNIGSMEKALETVNYLVAELHRGK